MTKNKPISRLCGTFLDFNVSNSRGYDLSINKYKKIEYVPVEYPPTEEILAEIEKLNEEITKETAELRALLRK